MQESVGKVKLNYTYYSGTDEYTDGPVEDEILDVVKNNYPEEFNRIISERNSWPLLYHLSDLRHNILDAVDFDGTENVLEVGAGCGAITGYLADKAGKVTCVELSEKRSLINAYRNRTHDNIEIMLGNFETVQEHLEEKYDVITLIGVFEYAQYYIDSKNPYEDFLAMLRNHLKEDGRIIIAIENKFGMKYWAGCKEDHINEVFAGIEGYVNTQRARTFSYKELEKMLQSQKLGNYKFYYPYPDYKFPLCIYSDEYLPKTGELKHNLRNYDEARLMLFDENLAFDNIIENDMFPFFSNSYLVICGREGKD